MDFPEVRSDSGGVWAPDVSRLISQPHDKQENPRLAGKRLLVDICPQDTDLFFVLAGNSLVPQVLVIMACRGITTSTVGNRLCQCRFRCHPGMRLVPVPWGRILQCSCFG